MNDKHEIRFIKKDTMQGHTLECDDYLIIAFNKGWTEPCYMYESDSDLARSFVKRLKKEHDDE